MNKYSIEFQSNKNKGLPLLVYCILKNDNSTVNVTMGSTKEHSLLRLYQQEVRSLSQPIKGTYWKERISFITNEYLTYKKV